MYYWCRFEIFIVLLFILDLNSFANANYAPALKPAIEKSHWFHNDFPAFMDYGTTHHFYTRLAGKKASTTASKSRSLVSSNTAPTKDGKLTKSTNVTVTKPALGMLGRQPGMKDKTLHGSLRHNTNESGKPFTGRNQPTTQENENIGRQSQYYHPKPELAKQTGQNQNQLLNSLPGASFWELGNPAAQPHTFTTSLPMFVSGAEMKPRSTVLYPGRQLLSNTAQNTAPAYPTTLHVAPANHTPLNVAAANHAPLNVAAANHAPLNVAPANHATLINHMKKYANTASTDPGMTIATKNAKDSLQKEVSVKIFEDDVNMYDYKDPSWDGVTLPTLLPKTTLRTTTVSTTHTTPLIPTLPPDHPIVARARKRMREFHLGYMSGFAAAFCEEIDNKEGADAQKLAAGAESTVNWLIQEGFLAHLGMPTVRYLEEFTQALHMGTPEELSALADKGYQYFENNSLQSLDVRAIIEEVEDWYTLAQGEHLLQTLIDVHNFPSNHNTSSEIMKEVMDALLRPYFSLGNSPRRQRLIELVNQAVQRRLFTKRRNRSKYKANVDEENDNEIERYDNNLIVNENTYDAVENVTDEAKGNYYLKRMVKEEDKSDIPNRSRPDPRPPIVAEIETNINKHYENRNKDSVDCTRDNIIDRKNRISNIIKAKVKNVIQRHLKNMNVTALRNLKSIHEMNKVYENRGDIANRETKLRDNVASHNQRIRFEKETRDKGHFTTNSDERNKNSETKYDIAMNQPGNTMNGNRHKNPHHKWQRPRNKVSESKQDNNVSDDDSSGNTITKIMKTKNIYRMKTTSIPAIDNDKNKYESNENVNGTAMVNSNNIKEANIHKNIDKSVNSHNLDYVELIKELYLNIDKAYNKTLARLPSMGPFLTSETAVKPTLLHRNNQYNHLRYKPPREHQKYIESVRHQKNVGRMGSYIHNHTKFHGKFLLQQNNIEKMGTHIDNHTKNRDTSFQQNQYIDRLGPYIHNHTKLHKTSFQQKKYIDRLGPYIHNHMTVRETTLQHPKNIERMETHIHNHTKNVIPINHVYFHNYNKHKNHPIKILQKRIIPKSTTIYTRLYTHLYTTRTYKTYKPRYEKSKFRVSPANIHSRNQNEVDKTRRKFYENFLNDKNLKQERDPAESSDGGAETILKLKLSDAVRHGDNINFVDGRKKFEMKKKNLNAMTSESDEEGIFKNNIYRVFGDVSHVNSNIEINEE